MMQKTRTISLRMPINLFEAAMEAAEAEKTTLADFTRRAVAAALSKKNDSVRLDGLEARLSAKIDAAAVRIVRELVATE